MRALEREILADIAEVLETFDVSLGEHNRSEIATIKSKLQSLELLARIEAEQPAPPSLLKRLRALEPLLVAFTALLLLIAVLLGIDPKTLLP